MKTKFTYTLLAAAAVCSLANAQTAYTTPVGYSSQTLAQGINACGLTLQTPTIASGIIDAIVSTALTDNNITYSPISGRTYVLEITSSVTSALVGTIQEVPAASISGSTITTPQNLAALGLAAGDSYSLRIAPTLEEIFGTVTLNSGGVLQNGISATGADIIWVPTGPNTYNKYFLHTSGVFRIAGTTTAAANVPIIYADGLYVQKKGATVATLTVSGEVKTTRTNSVISQGLNLLGVVAPVGLNLANAGFEDDLQAGISATGADIVWIQQPNLSYIKYFRHTSGFWRSASAPTVNLTAGQAESVNISNGFIIQRKGASSVNLDLNVPSAYSTL
ncbi:MAG: hypothetical protein ACK49N_09035 [Verrucomicrobiota bacterium]